MTPESTTRLLGDIGGTNARFAWQAAPGATISNAATYPCAQYDSLLTAIRHYLQAHGIANPSECAIGIANPIVGDRVQMTNHHWSFSIEGLKDDLGLHRLAVINDFTALALSLPALGPSDLRAIGSGAAVAGAPQALIGPGTGLGVSGLLPDGAGGWFPVNGEGGHVTLAPYDAHETAVLDHLRARHGHVSAERALSGPGLVNLYHAICAIAGTPAEPGPGPSDIIERSRSGEVHALGAVDLFCSLLGSVAGDLALTLGARGGVFIGGGIAPRLIEELRRAKFRQRFTQKGRMRDYLEPIPTWVISTDLSPALLGAARALDRAPTKG